MAEVKGFLKLKRAPEKLTGLTAAFENIIAEANSSLHRFEDQDADNLESVKVAEESIEKILRRLQTLNDCIQNSGVYYQELLKVDCFVCLH